MVDVLDTSEERDFELLDAPIMQALTKDLKASAQLLTAAQVRYLVDMYYNLQESRIRTADQVRRANGIEPNAVLSMFEDACETLEGRMKAALAAYTEGSEVGKWLRAIVGIGPVIAAGLLAHLDVSRTTSCGKLWRFAGLDPTVTWNRGEKRPWNANLKVIGWKAGESFVKQSGRDNCLYGKIYLKRKAWETEQNAKKKYADQAAEIIARKNYSHDTIAYGHYKEGQLPPGHIHARAKRYAVKFFLSHLFEVAYFHHYRQMPPKPYSIIHLEHTDYIPPPNMDLIKGMPEAFKAREKGPF